MQPMWLVMPPLISTDQLDVADVIQGQVKNIRFSRLLALYSEDWKWWCQQQLGQKEGAMQDETTTQSMDAVPRWPLDVRLFEKSTWRLDEKSDTGYMEGWAKLIYSANNLDCLYSFPDIELTRGVKTTEGQMLPFIAGVRTLGRCWTFSDFMQPMWLVLLPLISTDQLDVADVIQGQVADVIQGQVKNNRFSRLLALYSEDWKWWCQQQCGQKAGAMQDGTTTQSMDAVPR